MRCIPSRLVLTALLVAAPAAAQSPAVSVQFHNGNVTLKTQNAPLQSILREWARAGGMTFVNLERVNSAPLTLELTNVPERDALATLLRGTSGYIIGARQVASSGPSSYDRVLILPPSTVSPTTRVVSNSPSPLPQPLAAPPTSAPVAFVPGDVDNANDPPADGRVLTAAQLQNQINARQAAGRQVEQAPPQDTPPRTAQPATTPANPFFGGPSGRPGEIAPAPQPRNPLRPNGDPEP